MEERRKFWVFLAFTILVILMLFFYIEAIHPYNFVKDDNFAQFLPVLIEGMEQIFSGNLPLINFHQFMGSKILEVGTYALLYPPMILSYIISHFILSNDFLLIDIFALMHILAAGIITYFYLARYSNRNSLNFLAALAVSFSGYALIAGSNWYYVLPSIAFVPLLLYMNDKLFDRTSLRTSILLGVIRGIYFYSGNAQYFAYAVFFELLYVLILAYRKTWKESKKAIGFYLLSQVFTIVIVLPLLLSQLSTVHESPRGNQNSINYLISMSSSPREAILGSLFVYPIVKSYNSFAYSPSSFIHIYYTGTFFALFFIVQALFLLKRRWRKILPEIHASFWLGIIALLLSLGTLGLIYIPGAFLPVIKSFSYPFKITLFTNIFVILSGAIFAGKALDKLKLDWKKVNRVVFLMGICFIILLLYHITLSTNVAWSYYGDKLPINTSYFKEIELENQRAISVFTNSSINPRNVKFSNNSKSFPEAESLSQNFATYYKLDHLAGYEPFEDKLTMESIPISRFGISDVSINLTSMREYGVKYVFIPNESIAFHSELSKLKVKSIKENITILEIDESKGYVFSDEGNLPFNISGNDILFKSDLNESKNVTINFLYKKNYRAFVNGKNTEIWKDYYGRMVFLVPEGKAEIRITYVPTEFILGIYISIALLMILILVYVRREDILPYWTRIIDESERKASPKVLKIIFALLVFVLLIIISVSFIGSINDNMKDIFEQRTGIPIELKSILFNPFTGKIQINNLSSGISEGKEAFRAEKMIMDLSYKDSIKESINMKSLRVIFEKISFLNISIKVEPLSANNNSASCLFPLKIGTFKKMEVLKNITFANDEISLSSVSFVPFNRLFVPYQYLSLKMENEEIPIGINFTVSQYFQGNLDIGEEKDITIIKCVKLPREIKNNLYYISSDIHT